MKEQKPETMQKKEDHLTHFDASGNAVMVDISDKAVTQRTATATGKMHVSREVMHAIMQGTAKKGDVLGVARVAGIMAVKETSRLIPLCHTLLLQKSSVDFSLDEEQCIVEARCTVSCQGRTGVEMEALTGVSVTLLTIYDMCKAMDRAMEMTDIHLVEKAGGNSGHFLYDRS